MSIVADSVSKRFGDFVALDDVSLEVRDGSLTALLGPSGGGKSTLLRVIAGLEVPDSGTVMIAGEDATQKPPQRRNVGFVFQHYAAFKHMTVAKNVAFGLTIRKRPKEEIDARVDELLKLVHLDGFAHRYPSQLSGGQRQRMALARALAVQPRVLLLDEPFGALDARVRQELRLWLRRLHDEVHVTSVFVTHDQEEALEVADRIVVMNHARVEQVGTPDEVYDHPATPFVYQFLGDVNVFHGRISQDRTSHDEASGQEADASGEHEVTFVRPHDLELSLSRTTTTQLEATVRFVITAGSRVRLELVSKDSSQTIAVELTRERYRELNLRQGDVVFVHPKQLQVFKMPGPS